MFFCLGIIHSNAQVNISQEIFPAQINKDEFATLKIIIENSNTIQKVTAPSFKNFIVLSGPNQENGMTSINGNVKRYSALTFVLKPKRPGKINIDAAIVNIAGKMYKTNTTELLVNNAATGKGPGNNVATNPFANFDPFAEERSTADFTDYILHKGENVTDKANKNMQLRLETDKKTCFVGEPIVATYKLYTRLKSESKLTQNPSFNGFSVIDLTRPDISNGYTRQKLNGREYNVYTIRKAQLYPLQPGNIDLEEAELENNIQFIKDDYVNKRNNDVFGLFDEFAAATVPPEGIISQTVNLKSMPVTILVKPLPETNKPVSFTGAVGNFSVDVQLQKTNFPANESGKLIIRISGNGNLQLLTAPVLEWPAGIDPYDPKVSEELDKTAVPVRGSKTFEYSFSVNAPGNYSLPPVKFSYFDPNTASYRTTASKEISLIVTKATGPSQVAPVLSNNKETVSGINKIFNNRWWIIEFIAVIMMIGLIIWVRKDKRSTKDINNLKVVDKEQEVKLNTILETSAINQQNPLIKTEECLYHDNCNGFYSLLNTELKSYLANKFSVDPSEINTKNISIIMDKKNIGNETALQLQQLLQEIEWQLYTPFERNEKMNELYQEAHDIIQQVNTYDIMHL
ncbi:MAG: BatD family protein [Ferruginibacter sp.]